MNNNNQNTQRKRKSPCRNTNEHDEEHPTITNHHHQQQQSIHESNINALLDDVLPSNPQPESPKNISEPQHSQDQREAKQVRSDNKPKKIKIPNTTPIDAPFPWATDRRATVHTLEYLLRNGRKTISGQVECKTCSRYYRIDYDLQQKFQNIRTIIVQQQHEWNDRAPDYWLDCILPKCKTCTQKICKPVISKKKRSIDWLFLLLGQLLGCCSVPQLRYFCKYSNIPRRSKIKKDQLLLYTYLALCKQLDPDGPFRYPTTVAV